MEHKVIVIADGKFSIHQLVFQIDLGEYSEATGENLMEKLMSRALIAGYSSILGVKSVDDIDEAAVIFRPAFRVFPEFCKSIVRELDHISVIKKEMERLSEGQEERRAFLVKMSNESAGYIKHSYKALALCGVDVDDSDTEKRVLSNLGFYRTV